MPIVKKQKFGSINNSKATASSDKESKIALPTKLNEPPTELGDYTICLFGEKGIGKSSLAAQFPDSLVFMFEPGRRNLRIRQIPDSSRKEEPLTWKRFKKYIASVLNDDTIQTVVIDTIDRCYNLCFDYVCHEAGVKHPHDAQDYGKTWKAIPQEFEKVINKLLFSNKGVIFISHAIMKDVVTATKDEYNLIIPTCDKDPFNFMKAAVDIVFYYGYIKKERYLTLRGNDLVWSACGLEDNFKNVEKIPMGNSAEEGYKNVLKAFNNKLVIK